ncbi:MAG: T9SS C-terminal target domain-containing protein [Bacteroidia bacterium]|nr:T9SS C-terminal target domain-containing protein [Bacteroidia bacterium]
MKKSLLFCALVMGTGFFLIARENAGTGPRRESPAQSLSSGCDPGTSQMDLAVNNVRTTVLVSGDMWWDLSNPKYEIPRGSGKHSMFSGSLWIGGIDAGGQLKVAAMTYRQSGSDFWPGPLDNMAGITQDMCRRYDHHYKITRKEVEEFVAGTISPTANITSWPGTGPDGQTLAPFVDVNGDNVYEPSAGDYPGYNLNSVPDGDCTGYIYGDETIWWVFNDRGNIHTESEAEAIGLEIQAQAFAFSTNDEINDMTFYQYKIINRSTYQLNQTYFGQWVDADLGYYKDDYVGCDVPKGLGYCYNADNDDELNQGGYGSNPPAIGVDFFMGPLADFGDGINNDRDSLLDEIGEQIIMSKFVYYNNDWTERGNPENGMDIYGYLRGFWKDGTPITYGGNGYSGTTPCDFMFPGDSDHEWEWGTGGSFGSGAAPQPDWYESIQPDDRRFLQSAGAFTLKPGAVNFITTGVVWARASSGGALASVDLLKKADEKAQALFNNCFKLIDGPDAPDLTLQELDRQLILYLGNKVTGNNYNESYEETDPTIISPVNVIPPWDNTYNFEGYKIYQLRNASVSVTDLHNPDLARLAAQVDLENFDPAGAPVGQLVNFYYNPSLGANVPVEEVNGENKGILHSFVISTDQFATGDPRLVNHKEYYFMVVAYAYNNYKEYEPANPLGLDGQKKPYLQGRKNVKVYKGIPHLPAPEQYGTSQGSSYGIGPKLRREEGQGNGGLILDLTSETVNEILNSPVHRSFRPLYENGGGPVKIKVVDPLNVPDADFTFRLNGTGNTATWTLKNEQSGVQKNSDRTIQSGNEQLIPEWGISVWIEQVPGIGNGSPDGGFLEGTLQFSDPARPWLTGIPDEDGHSYQNWIRSGRYAHAGGEFNDYNYSLNAQNQVVGSGLDDDGVYEKMIGGTWAPYRMCARNQFGPAWLDAVSHNLSLLSKLAGVDIVITPDKSKWTRCAVLEMCDDNTLSEGNAVKHHLRRHPSVDKNGQPDGSGTMGLGWFPGYAINVETGERLNMAFGENSFLGGHNGKDLIWNPDGVITDAPFETIFGGQHYIYVFGHSMGAGFMPGYDSAAYIHSKLATGNYNPMNTDLKFVYRDAMWVGMPLLAEGRSLLECEVKIRLRVAKPYKADWAVDGSPAPENSNFPMYTFSTSDLKSSTHNQPVAADALSLIQVVPNPYYGYSAYEKNSSDTRIKITNLPVKCLIRIYTLNGTLVRTITRDDATTTFSEWDLKNEAGIPIAGGMYIIHVDAEGIGERILKWFGVIRPQDLGTF